MSGLIEENRSNEFIPPKSIILNNYLYKFKDKLKNNYYTYRCKTRKECGAVIKIEKSELEKYIDNNNDHIKYEFTGNKKFHTCQNKEKNSKDHDNNLGSDESLNSEDKPKTDSELIITSMILNNIEKPLKFHIDNFKNNNINLTENQIKWRLQKIREKNFPNDAEFLKDISNINISFDNSHELQNIPFCYKVVNMINPEKNNNLEKYIIFTSKIQMNLLTKTNQLLIDGTFKFCPRGYYQIINIAGYYSEIDSIIPIFMIPSTGKSFFLYNSIFGDVKKILFDNEIDIKKIPKRIIIDFEKGLQKAIKQNFPDSTIDGCYFHYVKLLWGKAKKFGMCKKNELSTTKILLFVLKIFPFLRLDDKIEVFFKLEELFLNSENKYRKMIAYYKKIG
jgi:hypothetical protein